MTCPRSHSNLGASSLSSATVVPSLALGALLSHSPAPGAPLWGTSYAQPCMTGTVSTSPASVATTRRPHEGRRTSHYPGRWEEVPLSQLRSAPRFKLVSFHRLSPLPILPVLLGQSLTTRLHRLLLATVGLGPSQPHSVPWSPRCGDTGCWGVTAALPVASGVTTGTWWDLWASGTNKPSLQDCCKD